MKKLFTLMASFVLTLSAMAQAYMVDPSKEITVSELDLDGVIGVLTNVEGTKVLSLGGGNEWDITSIDLSAWGSKYADYNYVLFERAYQGTNIYKIRMAKSDKTFYSPSWANPAGDGCINFQPGAGVFVGGNKDQDGTDIDAGGVFIVTKTATGYEIECQGKPAWLVPGIGQATTATSVKFYSALAVDLSASVETAYANRNSKVPAGVVVDWTAVDAAYATAKATPTQANLDALNAAIDAAVKVADRTSYITNPEINGSTGWTCEKPNGGNGPLLNNTAFEYWNSSSKNGAFDYYQVIKGLPAGKYILTADMYNSSNGESGATGPKGNAGVYAVAGETTVFSGITVDATTYSTYATEAIEVMGDLCIGVKNNGSMEGARWFSADNFKLWYAGEVDLSKVKAALQASVDVATGMLTSTMGQPYVTQEWVDAVNAAIEAAELSANPTFAEINEKLVALNAANEKNAADIETARKAYVKANPQPGDDLTFVITNPGIDGNSTGWTCEKPKGGGGPMKPSNDALEFWGGSANPRADASFDYYQTLTGLADGVYTLKAKLFNSLNGEAGAVFNASSGLYATVGETTYKTLVDVDSEVLAEYAVENIVVEGGVLKIGVKSFESMGARWFVADDFTLTYVGDKLPEPKPEYTESISMSYETGVLTITPSNNDMYYAINLASAGATTAEAMKANFDMLLNGYYESAEDMEDAVEWGELFKGTSELDNETLAMFEVNAGDEVTFYAVGLVWDGAKAAYCTEVVEYTFTADATTAIKNINTVANKNVMFNLAGQRVNNAKGIVIMNGKKALVK